MSEARQPGSEPAAWYTWEVNGVQEGPAYSSAAERDDAFVDALHAGSMPREEAVAAGFDLAALERDAAAAPPMEEQVKLVNWRQAGTEYAETVPEMPDGYVQGMLIERIVPRWLVSNGSCVVCDERARGRGGL